MSYGPGEVARSAIRIFPRVLSKTLYVLPKVLTLVLPKKEKIPLGSVISLFKGWAFQGTETFDSRSLSPPPPLPSLSSVAAKMSCYEYNYYAEMNECSRNYVVFFRQNKPRSANFPATFCGLLFVRVNLSGEAAARPPRPLSGLA